MGKTVGIKQLSNDAFKGYGSFANMVEPKNGKSPVEFIGDMGILSLGQTSEAAFSVTKVQKRDNIIDAMECHSFTGEGLLPLDGDVLIHVAPATRKDVIPMDRVEVFRVPKGTLVLLRPGVWHCAPFAEKADVVNVLVVLPERTYANDIVFYKVPKEDQIRIV